MTMMNMFFRIVGYFLAASVTVILFIGCETVDGTGSSTQSGITGKIYNDDGTPANNATISIIASGYIPSISGFKKSAPLDSFVTDDSGVYFIRWLPPGTYNIFGKKADCLSYQDSVMIDSSTTTIENDTLRKSGSISGIVRLQPNDDSRTVLILIYGCNTFTYPEDFTGHFSISDLAEGNYHIKVLTTIQGYTPKDTVITIVSGKNSTLQDTMQLDYEGIPTVTVTGLNALWDPLKQETNITWNKQDTSIIAGYNIYRGFVDSAFDDQPINPTMIISNRYRDTFDCAFADRWANKELIYKVKPINKKGYIGAFYSNADTVIAYSVFYLNRTITRHVFDSTDACIHRNKIYLINREKKGIDVYDTLGTFIKIIGAPDSATLENPRELAAFNRLIYVVDLKVSLSGVGSSVIKKFDTSGIFLSQTPVSGIVAGIGATDTTSFYTMSVDPYTGGYLINGITIHHRDQNGRAIDSVHIQDSADLWELPRLLIHESTITVAGNIRNKGSVTVVLFTISPDLSIINQSTLPLRFINSTFIDDRNYVYALAPEGVYIYDSSLALFAKFPILDQNSAISIAVIPDPKIYLKDNDGNINIYKKEY
jgi:hypothetical protein